MVFGLVAVASCDGGYAVDERPPPAGERVAVDFATRLVAADRRQAIGLVSEEMPPTGDVAGSVEDYHDELSQLRARVSGDIRWVGESVLSPDSLQIPFEGVDEGGDPTAGVIIVRVREEGGAWRVSSYGFAITEGVLS